MESKKLTVLKWFDILILTIILFGDGIINSTLQYIALQNQTTTLQENLTFSTMDNYKALALQLVWLTIAIFYLLLRNFDFSIWKNIFLLLLGFHYKLLPYSFFLHYAWISII